MGIRGPLSGKNQGVQLVSPLGSLPCYREGTTKAPLATLRAVKCTSYLPPPSDPSTAQRELKTLAHAELTPMRIVLNGFKVAQLLSLHLSRSSCRNRRRTRLRSVLMRHQAKPERQHKLVLGLRRAPLMSLQRDPALVLHHRRFAQELLAPGQRS